MYILANICEQPSMLRVIKFILALLNIVRILIPIVLIVMITLDLGKNVLASNDDEMKKNFNIAKRRIIMAIAIFLVPTIVNISLSLVEGISNGTLKAYTTCKNNLSDIDTFEAKLKAEQAQYEEENKDKKSANKKKMI